MTNVTFDPLALGNGGGTAATEVRGRLAAEVRSTGEADIIRPISLWLRHRTAPSFRERAPVVEPGDGRARQCGTQLYFMFLARRLHEASLEALSEKDELIAEFEQAKANSDLARRRAEAANLAKSRFLATMRNQLRTPLTPFSAFPKS